MTTRRLSILIILLLFTGLVTASPAQAVTAENIAVSRVTSTTAVIVVKSDVVSDVMVEYGQSPGVYTSTVISYDHDRHEVGIVGLAGFTSVYYRVTITDSANPADTLTLPGNRFFTPRAPGIPFSYSVSGDNRPATDTAVQPAAWNTIVTQMTGEGLDLALNVGDIIYGTWSDSLSQNVAKYAGLFDVTAQLTDTTPLYVAPGNHERLSYANSQAGYEQEFSFPENAGGDYATYAEHYYSFDSGDTHFIALSTEIPGQEGLITGNQQAWLEADLAATDQPWIVVFMHRPLFAGRHSGDPWVNILNIPGQVNKAEIHSLFLQSGVDIVFEGHDHYYLRHEEDGIQYVITGGGGAPLSAAPPLGAGDVFAASAYQHVKVDETASSLTVTAIDSTGATLESFALTIPQLALTVDNAYWGSYADYMSRNLSVSFTLANGGAGDALALQALSLTANRGVTSLTPTPYSLGTLGAGASTNPVVNFHVPQGVESFLASFSASCQDDRGFLYTFP